MVSPAGRFTWTDFAMTLATLGFAAYLIESQHLSVGAAIPTALGTVAGIAAIILVPKGIRGVASRLRQLDRVLAASPEPGPTLGLVPDSK